ncbi:unnamed protein product [Spirodela intermedia]|uniref:Uncharacterized protein n=1 Tax=Spirodela intermedia TaxID=51605 RepID=A0A7I8IYV3_SPIIN|nr:unnamed protein product [Spirodela intermedia]CAA6662902.1 unnamed protein product [Spirodela intermedia]
MCYCTPGELPTGHRCDGDKDVEDIYVRVVKPSKGVRELTAFELIV